MKHAHVGPNKQILPVDIVAPGSLGLNTVQAGELIDPRYAVAALNAVIDTNGRLSARYGIQQFCNAQLQNGPVKELAEWKSSPTTYNQIGVVANAANTVWTPFNNWQTETAVTPGTATLTTARWFFQAFNNKLIGFQPATVPVVYTGGAWNLIVASQGVAPTSSGVGAACFGRVWVANVDGHTINYSGLLDETDWGSQSSGAIDMNTIWTDGTDTITAIFAFNAALVVCGLKHIVFFTDGRGSLLGLDPTQSYVYDVLLGTGCMSQWTVDHVGQADVLFLSPNGVQSLQRLETSRSNPVEALTKMVRDQLLGQLIAETAVTTGLAPQVSGAYNALTGFYLLCLPANKLIYCLDMRRLYMDAEQAQLCPVTEWATPLACWSIVTDHTNTTYIGTDAGLVSIYNITASPAFVDATGVGTTGTYPFEWTSPWMNFAAQAGEQVGTRIKILKQYNTILNTGGNTSLTLQWNTDFQLNPLSVSMTLAGGLQSSQYGISQYGSNSVPLSQYGLNSSLLSTSYDARGRGQYYQIGISATPTGPLSLQQIQLNLKLGRISGPLVT